MIYLLSDVHSNPDFPGLKKYLSEAKEDDLLIILGDTELNFEKSVKNKLFTEEFLKADKKIAIVDGNHDNFEYLHSFPEEEWNGGTVGRLTDNIVFLKRGNAYKINGMSFFVFGGCKSSPKWKEMGLWFEGEEPTDSQLALAYETIKSNNFSFDYILTHKYESVNSHGTPCQKLRELTSYIEENVSYKAWYSGHWHRYEKTDEKHFIVYDEPIKI